MGLAFACTFGCASSEHIPARPTLTATASHASVAATTTAPTPPPFSLLASPGDVFLLVAEHGRATCQRWTVAPGAAGAVQLRRDGDTVDLSVSADTLTIVGRRDDAADSEATSCGDTLAAHELGDAGSARDLDVAGARWFARGEDCDRALAQHQRVAMDLTRCQPQAPLPERVAAATHARLDRVLARGGTMYSDTDGTCRPVRVVPSRVPGGPLAGSFISEQRRGRRRSIETYGYEKRPGADEIWLSGPSSREIDGDYEISGGLLCSDVSDVDLGRDTALGMYFTRASCRAARAVELANASWLPAEADEATPTTDITDDQVAVAVLPYGGC